MGCHFISDTAREPENGKDGKWLHKHTKQWFNENVIMQKVPYYVMWAFSKCLFVKGLMNIWFFCSGETFVKYLPLVFQMHFRVVMFLFCSIAVTHTKAVNVCHTSVGLPCRQWNQHLCNQLLQARHCTGVSAPLTVVVNSANTKHTLTFNCFFEHVWGPHVFWHCKDNQLPFLSQLSISAVLVPPCSRSMFTQVDLGHLFPSVLQSP